MKWDVNTTVSFDQQPASCVGSVLVNRGLSWVVLWPYFGVCSENEGAEQHQSSEEELSVLQAGPQHVWSLASQ